MSTPRQINITIVSHAQDDAEMINRTLRNAGLAARCEWCQDADSFARQVSPETHLVIARRDQQSPSPAAICAVAHKQDFPLATLWLDDVADDVVITEALRAGAADVLPANNLERLALTLERTLQHAELERRINHSRHDAATIQKQISSLIDNVPDAIAHVQEGIIVEVNKAWVNLVGQKSDDDCVATPLMDAVSKNSQDALKGALKAISMDRWPGEPLDVELTKSDGSDVYVPMLLEAAHFDGEPAVRIAVKPQEQDDKRVNSLLRDAAKKDPSTFLYHRKYFLKLIQHRLETPLEQGQRFLAWIRIDDFRSIRDELGVLLSEEVLADFAEFLRQRIDRADIAGRFEGTAFTLLMERGSEQEAINWAKAFAHAVGERVFGAGDRTLSLSCGIGICPHNAVAPTVEDLMNISEQTYRSAHSAGRGQVRLHETDDEDTRIRNHDAMWAKRITEALKENRFRLLQQPIAALDGEASTMFDILVRMVNEQDEVIAPSEFLPAAKRSHMLHAIDRWVIGASMALCRERRPDLVFLRMSEQSLIDKSFTAWLKTMISRAQINPATVCFQVTEETALSYLKATAQLSTFVRALGCRFAIEHCGISDKSEKLVGNLPLDFVKIDGALIANLSSDDDARARTKAIVEAATNRSIQTIAEKVQDANTMAALWQLGISFMQGHYVQEPEVVLQESA
ncbi:MAG: EAL domain-containing protein [Pseudomonadota bacterium]